MSGHEQDTDIQESTPNSTGPERAEGGMGVSSERVGPAGPDQVATDGVRDVSPHESAPDADPLPEQSRGGEEQNPEGRAPKAGYPSLNPNSKDAPYEAPPQV